MKNAKIIFVKILRKIGLLNSINFKLKKKYNQKEVVIPFINGIGLTNLVLKKNWLDYLIGHFVKEDGSVFIDVGVNIGQTLIKVKSIFPKVKYIGFEPNSTCTSYVNQLVKHNNYSDCVVQNLALSDKIQSLILEKTLIDDSRASLISGLRPNYFIDSEHVFALDYQSMYMEEKISFVKIDVEGAEYEVIKGMEKAILKHLPIITCEVLDSHSDEVYDFTQHRATLLSELLNSMNYGIIRFYTSLTTGNIVSFEKIDTIDIKNWTIESYELNDYLFYPIAKELEVIDGLVTLCR